MRFLKKKIHLAQEFLLKKSSSNTHSNSIEDSLLAEKEIQQKIKESNTNSTIGLNQCDKITGKNVQKNEPDGFKSTKNLVINYGKAIATFASSELALPYLKAFTEKENISLTEFTQFIARAKDRIGGIASFRSLLIIDENDDQNLAGFKRIFRLICEIFIKYFSVNWIIHGRVTNKMTYLKYRFKMLRRIRSPEYFTYVRGTNKNQVPSE